MSVSQRRRIRLADREQRRWLALLLVLMPGVIGADLTPRLHVTRPLAEVTTIRPGTAVGESGKAGQRPATRNARHRARQEERLPRVHRPPALVPGIRAQTPRSAARARLPEQPPDAPVAGTIAAEAPAATPDEMPANLAPSAAWFDVEINGRKPGIALLLRDAAGRLWARAADLQLWRLRPPPGNALLSNDEAFYPLDAFPGLDYRVDDATETVVIGAPARLFTETIIAAAGPRFATPDRSPPGGFINYDVFATHTGGAAAVVGTTTTGVFEAGTFNRWGTGTTSFVRSYSLGSARLIRLDTTWTDDRPEALASLRIGDSISGASSWGGAVHFGGVQWSTDFTTQPGLVTTPLAAVRGEAVLPSTVDLYVNEALRLHTEVPAGPFSITNLAMVSGAGAAQLVVTDVLGRQQLVSVPFYSTPTLLRPGLSSFSYEIGAARDNYGLGSYDYGRGLAVGTNRYGFTNSFTGEVHAELLRDQQTLGLGAVLLARGLGVLSVSVAGSHATRGDGELLQLGIEHQARNFGLGASARLATPQYVQIGMRPGELAATRVLQGFLSFPVAHRGSMSLNYIQQDYRDQSPVHLLSGQASWPVSRSGFVGVSVTKPLRCGGAPTLAVNMTYSLGPRTSANIGVSRQAGSSQELAQVQQNLPAGSGLGYQLVAGAGTTDLRDATFSYQNDVGTYAVRAATVDSQTGVSAEARGSIVMLDGEWLASRRLDQSFAVVHVGDYPNVRVYADNQEVGRTDSTGTALVPNLRPYERNPVSIEQADLPLDADIDTLEKDAVPYRRRGVRVGFDVKPSAGALVTLILEDGAPVPVGAVAQLAGRDSDYPVGERGEAYITGLSGSSLVRVGWDEHACVVTVTFVPSTDPLPKLGPYVCRRAGP